MYLLTKIFERFKMIERKIEEGQRMKTSKKIKDGKKNKIRA